MKTKAMALSALLLAGLSAPAFARDWDDADRWQDRNGWEQIGQQQADMRRDHDTVNVKGNERYRQIRLCVEQSPLRMRDLDVKYENGGKQNVSVRKHFRPGTCTRAIDLRGERGRNIAQIDLLYDRRGEGGPAIVNVYAR